MTERKTTGASPLIDIIKEVYDTKKRMKKVINTVIETNSDDFEEYATLTRNVRNTMWNKGVKDGWTDGWHQIFPNDVIEESMYSDMLKTIYYYSPAIPTYSTDTYIDNLVDVMRDSLRCRLLLKTALSTESDEFVTYPDLLEAYIDSEYQDAYDAAYQAAYEEAIDLSFVPPTIKQHRLTIEIINNADFGDIYYWLDNATIDNKVAYTGEFTINRRTIIHAVMMYQGRYSAITTWIGIIPEEEEFTIYIDDDIPTTTATGEGTYINLCILSSGTWQQAYIDNTFEFSINDGNWNPLFEGNSWFPKGIYLYAVATSLSPAPPTYELKKGDTIRFRGNCTASLNIGVCTSSYINGRRYTSYIKHQVLGNFLSLFNKTSYLSISDLSTLGSIPNTGIIHFQRNDAICSGIENIGFSATTLCKSCYQDMFTTVNAEVPPTLNPNATLAEDCYNRMFGGAKIRNAPALPATTLAKGCYYLMFSGCSLLSTAPELPATTLAEDCYKAMFFNCTSLTTAPELPATTLVRGCYQQMFEGCVRLTQAPVLEATYIPNISYYRMFYDCHNLSSVTCLALRVDNNDSLNYWLYNTASNGILYKHPEALTDETFGSHKTWVTLHEAGGSRINNYVPLDWTIVDAA